ENGRCTRRNGVAVLAEPGLEAVALRGGEDEDVVLADGVARFDRDAETAGALLSADSFHLRHSSHRSHTIHHVHPARVVIEVLHQPPRGIRIEMIDEGLVSDVNPN